MLRIKKSWLFPVVLALASPLSALSAADAPVKPDPAKAEKPNVSQALTDEALQTMLQNLGYEPEVIKSTNGNPMYLLKFDRDGWTFVMYVSLSSDKSVMWFSAPLPELPDGTKIPAHRLEKLLAKNFDIGPCYFCVHGGRRLYLEKSLPNRYLTPSLLRGEIDAFTATLKESGPLWDVKKWNDAAPDASAKPEAKAPAKPDTTPAKPADKAPVDLKELFKQKGDGK